MKKRSTWILPITAAFCLYLNGCDDDEVSGWLDETTNLRWQTEYPNLKAGEVSTERKATHTWSEAVAYCLELGDGWRLPTVTELRTLIRGCDRIEWDTEWTSVPEGVCAVHDNCLSWYNVSVRTTPSG